MHHSQDAKAKVRIYKCTICNQWVDHTTKHCGECNRCVKKFDHHCLFLNNCIGARNYKPFLALLNAYAA